MVENDESMDAPKNVLFHWKYNNYEKDTKSSNPSTHQNLSISLANMKIMKIRWTQQKSTTPRMLRITDVLEEKNYVGAPRQKSTTPRMLIITVVFEEKTMLRLQDKNQALQECL